MSDPLADLKRRAYARPLSDDDAAEAQAELARLIRADKQPDWAAPQARRFAVTGTGPRVVIGVAAGLALAGGIALPSPAPQSIAVFAREQTAEDLSAPPWAMGLHNDLPGFEVDQSTIRWLTDENDSRLFTYLTRGGSVCLTLVLETSAATNCATADDFAAQGLVLQFGMTVDQKPVNTAVWGPDSSPHIYDGPAPRGWQS